MMLRKLQSIMDDDSYSLYDVLRTVITTVRHRGAMGNQTLQLLYLMSAESWGAEVAQASISRLLSLKGLQSLQSHVLRDMKLSDIARNIVIVIMNISN